jgi:hypothetical protein
MYRNNKKANKQAGHSTDYYFESSLQDGEQNEYNEAYDYEIDSRYAYKKGNVKAGKLKTGKHKQGGEYYDYKGNKYENQSSPTHLYGKSYYDTGYGQHKGTRTNQDISNILRRKENLNRMIANIEVPELTMNLINGLIESNVECLICNENLKDQDEIWECSKCFTIFHNTCIYDWIFKLNSQNQNAQIFKWTCPHCSNITQTQIDKLPVYNCYCTRFFKVQKDKHFNPSLIPHGCGVPCNFQVCKHLTCKIPCHPGPHMICNVTENVVCYCTKQSKDIPCSSGIKIYSCGNVARKLHHVQHHVVKCSHVVHIFVI